MAWLILLAAGVFEIAWAVGLRYWREVEGLERFWVITGTVVAMVASVVLLGLAMQKLPLGTSYAVWTGIGAAGTAILGIILFGESVSLSRLFCIALVVGGVIGLKLTHEDQHPTPGTPDSFSNLNR